MSVVQIGKQAKLAANLLRKGQMQQRYQALTAMSQAIVDQMDRIIEANNKDMLEADKSKLSDAMKDRLKLDRPRIESMAKGVLEVRDQDEVVGKIVSEFTRPDGLKVQKQLIPLGVLAMIFESRPNVVVDCSAIAIKSANAIILKGGKEAYHSNKVLGDIIRESIATFIPKDSIQVLDSFDRKTVEGLLTLKDYVDLIIPRGGEKLIEYVYENAKVPVIAHFKGLCHLYIDKDVDHDKTIKIVLNAKAQRPGVCNALETLLVHEDLLSTLLPKLLQRLHDADIETRLDKRSLSICPGNPQANDEDWNTEYLDRILSIKSVANLEEAIEHIEKHGSHHTEGIISNDPESIKQFSLSVDASCIAINSSTRFNDGGQLGLGAELGISTTKFHAYGPMGAAELTTARYVVTGDGHIRS